VALAALALAGTTAMRVSASRAPTAAARVILGSFDEVFDFYGAYRT
jgi:hypothetical protein